MKKIISSLIALFLIISAIAQTPAVHLNSIGFLPKHGKTATIPEKCESFRVIDTKSGKEVFAGKTEGPKFQKDLNQSVWIADFSKFNKPGKYYVEVPGVGKSTEFEVAEDVYNFATKTSMRAFYLWRCGTAVRGEYNGDTFQNGICHMDDGYEDYIGKPGSKRDGTGGWHDAGDHGKYVVNAGVSLGVLFMAWDQFQKPLAKMNFDLPETAPGYPEFLKELKWETDWVLKMQYPDGSGRVSHKLTRTNFSGFIMPEDDHEKRYFTDWSSAATADFIGIMAMASRYFKPYDTAYAKKCLDAAWVSYRFLQENPEPKRFEQGDFRTGGYQTRDNDDRLWAAAEMWETTGNADCLKDFEKRAAEMDFKIEENWDWGNVSNLGMYTYALSKKRGKNPETEKAIRNNILADADNLVTKAENDVYGRPLGSRYYWGCNGTVARQVVNLQVANRIQHKEEYIETALGAVNHIFGNNYYNRSYVTGLGLNPPMHPHDRRSGADNIEAPWPGYIVGGGEKATNWLDEEAKYNLNEVCINWQSALVYALAAFAN